MTFFKELGVGLLAIIGMTIGLLLVAVFFEVAVDSVEAWWHVPVGFALALVVSGFALAVVGFAAAATCGMTAVGWFGMLAGHQPEGFTRHEGNRSRALADLVLFGACGLAGIALFRHGAAQGALNWAIEGLFLAGGGLVFGLLPLVPRLYFGFGARGRGPSRRQPRKERGAKTTAEASRDRPDIEVGNQVTILVTLAALGIGLSMAITNTTATLRLRDGRAALAYGDWAEGCIGADDFACAADARLDIVPARAGRLRIEHLGECEFGLFDRDGSEAPVLGAAALHRLGLSPAKAGERSRIVFDPSPGQSYQLRITAGAAGCRYYVRYHAEPTGAGPEPEAGR